MLGENRISNFKESLRRGEINLKNGNKFIREEKFHNVSKDDRRRNVWISRIFVFQHSKFDNMVRKNRTSNLGPL